MCWMWFLSIFRTGMLPPEKLYLNTLGWGLPNIYVHGFKLWPLTWEALESSLSEGFIGKWSVAWCYIAAKVSFLTFLLFPCGSSIVSDSSEAMRTITYGAKSDSGQDISLLSGKLIPILERLELLSEVCCFPYLLV